MNNLQLLAFIISGIFLIGAIILILFEVDDRRKRRYRK